MGELSDNIFGGGTPKTSIPEYWEGTIPWIQSSDLNTDELFNIAPNKYITDIAVKDSATKLVPANSIAIVTRVGVGKLAFMPFQYATSQDFLSLSNLNIDNIFSIFSIYRILQKELKNIQGTSIKGITKPDLLAKTISVPIKMEEQKKIGTFFKQLDNTITLHQRKLDKLKQLKQGYLQKLFPKPGETVPKIRFANFEGEWEENKLAILFKKGGSGGTPKSTNPDYYGGNIPFLGISDISNSNGYIYSTEKTITSKGLENSSAWVVPKGAISLAMYASVGKLAILNIDAATSQAFYNMVFHDNKLRDFIYQRLLMANEIGEWSKLISTGTQSNLNADKVKNFNIKLPIDIKEIGKIGSIFKQLDNSITIHQNKLNQLKTCKKALLQKMFI
ncbi:restriction endonuclease subunit S [Lactococcus formosensis]|uniref:Restriction endonuclease subunit S n=1 Tax=Lactococcus formosensis TaxID=1281486 RepID=A0A9X4SCU3_9LACT|nr:restriction endonuclease subunit S [Lactococcus formosensis]MDG6130283.1 restriction endonuclease subunit S [Lactococcus formosensis]MDG6146039.1 restriction endonuclease subunit S [Lactococcus formosensis]MDG6165123.1 restriction endonuclease subunit S [Lactococcus formosensis]MDG6169269.1 restriction endonuclease subunit S [Lactococcus formosensis]